MGDDSKEKLNGTQHWFCKIRATEYRLKDIGNSNRLLYLGRSNKKVTAKRTAVILMPVLRKAPNVACNAMRASVYSNTILIGHTDLRVGDEGMGCVFGEFIPTDNYYNFVQKTVWEFWSDNPNYEKWDALKINVQLANGYFVYPIGGYTFDDVEDFTDEPKRIDIAGLYRHVIEDYFQTVPPRSFVEDPWTTITIEQKLELEAELQREIKKPSTTILGSTQSDTHHILADYECSAVCRSYRADDVLFCINNKSTDKIYAVVHLTYSRKTEENPVWPLTTLYDDFDTFKKERTEPDD